MKHYGLARFNALSLQDFASSREASTVNEKDLSYIARTLSSSVAEALRL